MPIIHVLSPRSPPAGPPLLRRAARRHRPRRYCDPLAAPSARSRTACCREGPRPRRGGALAGRSPLTPVSARALGAPAHTQPSERDRHSGGNARRRGNRPADRRSPSPPPSGPRTPAGQHLRVPHIPRPPSTPPTLWDMSRRPPALLPWGFPQPQPVRQHRQHVRHLVHSPLVSLPDRRRARLRRRPRARSCPRLPRHHPHLAVEHRHVLAGIVVFTERTHATGSPSPTAYGVTVLSLWRRTMPRRRS